MSVDLAVAARFIGLQPGAVLLVRCSKASIAVKITEGMGLCSFCSPGLQGWIAMPAVFVLQSARAFIFLNQHGCAVQRARGM